MIGAVETVHHTAEGARAMRAQKGAIEAHCRRIFRARSARVSRYLWYPPRATVELAVPWWRAHWLWLNWRKLQCEALRDACLEVSGLVLLEFRVNFVLRGSQS
jgi:hypothetical protein